MAQGFLFVFDTCSQIIQAWSDGNPYYVDGAGEETSLIKPDN